MKKIFNQTLLIILSMLILFSVVGCGSYEDDPQKSPIIHYQIKSDKTKYAYGEEITIEFLFNTVNNGFSEKDGNTYCVKIKESSYYEIIGNREVYTDGSENNEKIKGEYNDYWYRAVFKIKITKVYCGTHYPEIVVKCVDDDWLDKEIPEDSLNRADQEFPFGVSDKVFEFTAVEDGVEFSPLYSTTPVPKSFFNSIIDFILDIFYDILYLFGYRTYY